MIFSETRGNDGLLPETATFSQAILSPIASYGGLYSPSSLPRLSTEFLSLRISDDYKKLAHALLSLFDIDMASSVVDRALNLYDLFDDPSNPVPVVKFNDDLYISELYHGPTRAFKDIALQPFGMLLSSLAIDSGEQLLILAATSGDTGPAALETFKNKENVRVACLYPGGGTSDVQRLQMVTEDAPNLKVIGIKGNFDDAQSALKSLLASKSFKNRLNEKGIRLSAANSVNFGRIIFQIIYHIHSYLELVRQQAIELGDKVYLNVPSGNFGNALGAFYALKMGLPVEKIIISSNDNNVLTDLIATGCYDIRDRSLIGTSSPAMDILISSNVERVLFDLFGATRTRDLMQQLTEKRFYRLSSTEHERLREIFSADYCSNEEGRIYIKKAFADGYLIDPHTATCFKGHQSCRELPLKSIIYSTAEWTKFSPVIDQALNGHSNITEIDSLKSIAETAKIKIPEVILGLFDKPVAQKSVIDKNLIESEILAFLD